MTEVQSTDTKTDKPHCDNIYRYSRWCRL